MENFWLNKKKKEEEQKEQVEKFTKIVWTLNPSYVQSDEHNPNCVYAYIVNCEIKKE